MNRAYIKNIQRTIGNSKGRYFAIMAIIALGVGFFSGIKVTKPAMVENANRFYSDTDMFDFKLMSSYGFEQHEVDEMKNNQNVLNAEGAYSIDFLYEIEGESDGDAPLKALSMPEHINKPELYVGRMPQNDHECVLDASKFNYNKTGVDVIGKKIKISEENSQNIKDSFKYDEYEVVGLVYSPLYISYERGTTTLGGGKLGGFVYIPDNGFNLDYYTEMYVTCQSGYHIYSDEYKNFIDEKKEVVEDIAVKNALMRFDELPVRLRLEEPVIYVLDRTANAGYACYDNDTSIVEGVAKVFPVFFFLIAALVCSTTMARMIDDERGQIGTLRALGYSDGTIIGKYMIYSGTAAVTGCLGGFFLGCYIFPYAIGKAYMMLYDFGRNVTFYFDWVLLIITILISLLCSMGTTYFACRNELRCMPADLIRPRAPVAGKRILLERITPIWKKMKFLHKITARNVFRFKKRMIMMVMGIAGCTALVMAGFGIKNSVSNIAEFQYDEIELYDMEITFAGKLSRDNSNSVSEIIGDDLDSISPLYKTTVNYDSGEGIKSVYLCAGEKADMEAVMNYKLWSKSKDYPEYGEVMISDGLSEIAGVGIGDNITFSDDSGKKITLRVSGIYTNYVWHYAFISPETYEGFFNETYEPNTMYVMLKNSADSYQIGGRIAKEQDVIKVTIVDEVRSILANTMKTLNVIVWLVIGCAGALAFIVLFNLSNINITERIREIATIKVLGFYPAETGSYVFRENLILTIIGITAGIPLGYLLNGFIISSIRIDMFIIKTTLFPISYILTIVIVLGFLVITDLSMRLKIEKIQMAESLKSIE